jgi:hypothetical protein
VYVRLPGERVASGNYSGVLDLELAGVAEAQSVSVSFSRSSGWAGVGGGLCVLAGIATSLFVAAFARQMAANATAMLPAARLRELAEGRLATLAVMRIDGAAMPGLVAALKQILRDLTRKELRSQGFISGWVPSAFGGGNATAAYAAYLQASRARGPARPRLCGQARRAARR